MLKKVDKYNYNFLFYDLRVSLIEKKFVKIFRLVCEYIRTLKETKRVNRNNNINRINRINRIN